VERYNNAKHDRYLLMERLKEEMEKEIVI